MGSVASFVQFKCTKYFLDNLMLVMKDMQCLNYNSESYISDDGSGIELRHGSFSMTSFRYLNSMKIFFPLKKLFSYVP